MLQLLFPPHQQTTELVMPRMRALHHPPACRILLLWGYLDLGTRWWPQMQDVVSLPEACKHIVVIVARIQAQMVHAIDYPLRPLYRRAVHGLQRQRLVRGIGPRDHDGQRGAAPIAQHAAFGAGFGPIYRAGAKSGTKRSVLSEGRGAPLAVV